MLFAGDLVDTEATEALGHRLAGLLRAGDLLVLTGPLGAGKTTLTRGLGAGLQVRGQVASPTFVLARTHPTASGVPLVHVDAYRLGGADELDDLDLDYEGSVVVVEWGAGLLDGVAESWLDVVIERPTGAGGELGDDGSDPEGSDPGGLPDPDPDDVADEPRRVTITAHGPRWEGVSLTTG
ncbi:tRNA (adenosine(37)-N6)-threonylcarbamoyltransferase complex ATPase subunit type 1 TsaE [Frigoribacterium sp. VKM Ac-2530]|uniref:tRNA (adenosine(37)-N6)-threonylcarbamoyltransferase complex ATPase subunit type 1 TsaE n=1 Tax=Frigoribacterium sp. VKM Ac-2530 TaxID=2783822 RepID=UPI00188BD1DD|nr:tRNA (adenosine(37)-N6)-threonylcarbamoyltransferase complex ATPase subunit type 1 TsaE [Frigoribacterium sp. VKM Ac-2530]